MPRAAKAAKVAAEGEEATSQLMTLISCAGPRTCGWRALAQAVTCAVGVEGCLEL